MKTTLTLTLTEEEIKIVRLALCNASIKTLCRAQAAKKEEDEAGRSDHYLSEGYYERHDAIKSIIERIDEE